MKKKVLFMKTFKKKSMQDRNGITLIALVITIIVLLILAGVSISMLNGENGILQRANDATGASKVAEEKEQIQLEVLGSYDEIGSLALENVNTHI